MFVCAWLLFQLIICFKEMMLKYNKYMHVSHISLSSQIISGMYVRTFFLRIWCELVDYPHKEKTGVIKYSKLEKIHNS